MLCWSNRTAVCAALALVLGCNAEPPGPKPTQISPNDPIPDPSTGTFRNAGPVAFSIYPMTDKTAWLSLPARGTGPKGGQVHYKNTTTLRTDFRPINDSGNWCVDLEMGADQRNVFLLRAFGDRESQEEEIIVTHKTDPAYMTPADKLRAASMPAPATQPDPTQSNRLRNGVTGVTATTNLAVRHPDTGAVMADGSVSLRGLTDGAKNVVRLENNPALATRWLKFKLREAAPVVEIKVESSKERPVSDYDIYLSDKFEPGPVGGDDWQKAFEVRDAHGDEAFPVRYVEARFVALVLHDEGHPLPRFAGVRVSEFSEIAVTTWHPRVMPAPAVGADIQRQEEFEVAQGPIAPTCANGGKE